MSGIKSSPPFPVLPCTGPCAGGIAWGFRPPNAVRGGRDIPVPELDTPLKGDDPPPTFSGPLGKLKGGSELEFSVIGGNKSAAFGKGLGSIGPDEPGTLELSWMLVAPPGLIIVGEGLAQITLDPEESRASHLEFGSFDGKELVCSFGISEGNGPD